MNNQADEFDLQPWRYDAPPTLFDLVQNNLLSNGLRILIHSCIRFSFALYHRFEARNTEFLRSLGPCILAANHSSHLDVLAIYSSFPLPRVNRIRSLAARDYFFSNAIKRAISFFIANIVPIAREGLNISTIRYCGKRLQEGTSFILFPEGGRSADGRLHTFQPGIALFALKYGIPIVPVGIDGTFQSQPKGAWVPRPRKIRILFGQPVDYSHFENTHDGRQKIAEDLQQRISALLEQLERDKDDWY
jgi:1-acyl-sn-glycerol-3-phosphate acyltransferase